MRRIYIAAWCLAPVGLLVWHYYGPGQRQLAADYAGDQIQKGANLEKQGQASQAATAYREAVATLPDSDKASQQRLRLASAKAEVAAGSLLEGQERLRTLLTELERDSAGSPELLSSTRHALAESSYYAAFLLRREGAEPDDWMPQAECARQNFRHLAEAANLPADNTRQAALKNLEATIKLQQMDLSQLLAASPPSKCPPCKNLSKRQKKNRGGEGNSEAGKQPQQAQRQPQDVRQDIRKAAGAGVNQVGGSGS